MEGLKDVFAICVSRPLKSVDDFRLVFAYAVVMSRYSNANHTVYMSFFHRDDWHVQFVEDDLKTPLPRTLTFTHADKIRELARRGEALGTLDRKQALESAIENGRGGIYLRLTPQQYSRLRSTR